MIAISLQSGSNGNCIYVEAEGIRLLFDSGISGIAAESRLAAYGRDIRDVAAVIISHDHSDHVSHAGVFQRKYGLPLYVTERTLEASKKRCRLGRLGEIRFFRAGDEIGFGPVVVRTVPTPHDGEDGSVFVVESGGKRLGVMTDLGHVFGGLVEEVAALDAVFIESNYDPAMLRSGPYPAFLKRRIQGPSGHISNLESAELLLSGRRLRWACLSHLSGENNEPAVAMRTHREVLGDRIRLYTASRQAPTGIFRI
jgi:phosphoribosyl 1,2-cyclic phosphodiesterase